MSWVFSTARLSLGFFDDIGGGRRAEFAKLHSAPACPQQASKSRGRMPRYPLVTTNDDCDAACSLRAGLSGWVRGTLEGPGRQKAKMAGRRPGTGCPGTHSRRRIQPAQPVRRCLQLSAVVCGCSLSPPSLLTLIKVLETSPRATL
jgi:hypothetical protein